MFTGLIEHVGVVVRVATLPAGRSLVIDLGPLAQGLAAGQSVAVDGVCLTAARIEGSQASFDVSPTTLETTTLATFETGRRANLERPITLQDLLGGHLVAGHVDGLATLQRWDDSGQGKIAHFKAPRSITDFMITKGSVALNGVSLTVAELGGEAFSVALIAETLARTNLGQLKPGHKVNIETDLIGKYIAKFVSGRAAQGLSMETLRQHGFA